MISFKARLSSIRFSKWHSRICTITKLCRKQTNWSTTLRPSRLQYHTSGRVQQLDRPSGHRSWSSNSSGSMLILLVCKRFTKKKTRSKVRSNERLEAWGSRCTMHKKLEIWLCSPNAKSYLTIWLRLRLKSGLMGSNRRWRTDTVRRPFTTSSI